MCNIQFLCATFYFVCFLTARNVISQNTEEPEPEPEVPSDIIDDYDETEPYCFRFTWVGPEFTNSTPINTTCDDYLDATNAVGVPCRQPLVYTYDGTPPDINYLWDHHRKSILCRQARGHVCAKITYSFDNELQNVTHMCTKVFATGKAITDGCYTQKINGYDNELCVCGSSSGPVKPCNEASPNFVSGGLTLLFTLYILSNNYRNYLT